MPKSSLLSLPLSRQILHGYNEPVANLIYSSSNRVSAAARHSMPKKTLVFLYFLAVIAVALGYNYFYKPFAAQPSSELVEQLPSPSPELDPKTALFSSLTDSDKVGLILAAPVVVSDELIASPSAMAEIAALRPGVVTLFGDRVSATQAAEVVARLRNITAQPRVLVAVDHEGGLVQRLSGEGFTFLPSWQQLCQFSASKQDEVVSVSAKELKAVGVDIVWGPVVDFASQHPVLGTRICSSEPQEVIEQARRLVATYRAEGLLPVLKHFPGIGGTTKDLHLTFDTVEITPDEAAIYQALLTDFPSVGVMVSHAGVVNQFAEVPCSLSLPCVGQVAANYPEVLVVTDALEMISAGHVAQDPTKPRDRTAPLAVTLEERAVAAVEAGNQVLVFGPTVTPAQLSLVKQRLLEKMAQDPSFSEKISVAAKRVVEVQWSNDVAVTDSTSNTAE